MEKNLIIYLKVTNLYLKKSGKIIMFKKEQEEV